MKVIFVFVLSAFLASLSLANEETTETFVGTQENGESCSMAVHRSFLQESGDPYIGISVFINKRGKERRYYVGFRENEKWIKDRNPQTARSVALVSQLNDDGIGGTNTSFSLTFDNGDPSSVKIVAREWVLFIRSKKRFECSSLTRSEKEPEEETDN